MGRVITILWVLIALVVVAIGYIRLAPSDPAVWNQPVSAEADRDFSAGAIRIILTGPDGLARLDDIARATPRTEVLAGSVAEGRITYVTRTRVIGFPDYTTAQQDGDQLTLYARLRFGRSDLGVNRARVEQWIDALQP
jgi:uncharacterized protein (DUF1499 family)